MKTYNKGKANEFCACNGQCAAGFRADRASGLIYGPYKRADGTFYLRAEHFSTDTRTCVYCGASSAGFEHESSTKANAKKNGIDL